MIFKKAIPRRTFLRGVGTTLALPLLDAMVPAFAGPTDTAAKPVVRMGFVYVPNGIIMDKWTPATEGAGFEMTPILEPLAPFRDRLLPCSADSTRSLPDDAAGRSRGATFVRKRRLPDGRSPEGDRRRRHSRGNFGGPNRGERTGQENSDRVSRVGPGSRPSGRRM